MNISTPSSTASQIRVTSRREQGGLIIVVNSDSPADLRVLTGEPLFIDGVDTPDTTGVLISAGSSIQLPPGDYNFKTHTNGVAASFTAFAFKKYRSEKGD